MTYPHKGRSCSPSKLGSKRGEVAPGFPRKGQTDVGRDDHLVTVHDTRKRPRDYIDPDDLTVADGLFAVVTTINEQIKACEDAGLRVGVQVVRDDYSNRVKIAVGLSREIETP